jgi:hypothetical protein
MADIDRMERLYYELRAEIKTLPSSLDKSAAISTLDVCYHLFDSAQRNCEPCDHVRIQPVVERPVKVFATDGDNNSNT